MFSRKKKGSLGVFLGFWLWTSFLFSHEHSEIPFQERSLAGSMYVQKLLSITHVDRGDTLDSLVHATQKRWLRPQYQERWHLQEREDPEKIEKITALFEDMGFFQEIFPKEKEYDYAIVLGAAFFRVEKRVNFLLHLWEKGIRFREIIFLGGKRPLDPEIEPARLFVRAQNPPQNEAEMMLYFYNHGDLPESMKELPFTLLSADQKEGKRAGRADTIRILNGHLSPQKKCLFISNQPYCIYEALVIKNTLSINNFFEIVGPIASLSDINTPVLLDNLARCLYEELQLQKKS